jgi:hypothetical protein
LRIDTIGRDIVSAGNDVEGETSAFGRVFYVYEDRLEHSRCSRWTRTLIVIHYAFLSFGIPRNQIRGLGFYSGSGVGAPRMSCREMKGTATEQSKRKPSLGKEPEPSKRGPRSRWRQKPKWHTTVGPSLEGNVASEKADAT